VRGRGDQQRQQRHEEQSFSHAGDRRRGPPGRRLPSGPT